MTCSVVTIQEISVALFVAVTLTMAVHTGYIESYMKMISNNAVCVSVPSLVTTTPSLSFCSQSCLTLGQPCKSLSYSESDNKCQISQSCGMIPCAIGYAKTYYMDTNSSLTNSTQSPVNLMCGATIADHSLTYHSYNPEYIIDGLAEQASGAQTFVTEDTNKFVTVDLGREYLVVYVVMWSYPPTSGYEYAEEMDIRVASTIAALNTADALCYYRPGRPTYRPETFNCTSSINGRYVRAGRVNSTTTFFSLAELEVYGY